MLRIGKSTPQPISDRQKGLRTLYEQFVKLYGGLLRDHPDLARESALAQEQEISASTGQLKAYKTAIHHAAVSEDDKKLAETEAFKTTVAVRDELAKTKELPKPMDVVGMDCEMICGSSLARVTIVDEDGAALLDELVRPRNAILDLNSRFSGISAEDMQAAVMGLDEVRAASCSFIGPDTVIVGHGLENDLRALRLLHSKVIDTAILFPHDKGPPYRRALRDLVKEKLGFFIQDRTNESGHSSLEDAKAALDVLKWQVREDGEP
ncbi:RNA exonuclease 3 [Vanrija albida]|uniref:RNA exonuclease 3 n=1 Tax=Vanrija albida TaxID=181172 RepID=A0ABR3PS84_9TREE